MVEDATLRAIKLDAAIRHFLSSARPWKTYGMKCPPHLKTLDESLLRKPHFPKDVPLESLDPTLVDMNLFRSNLLMTKCEVHSMSGFEEFEELKESMQPTQKHQGDYLFFAVTV